MQHTLRALRELLATVRDLLGPRGCPWDKAQTVQSLSRYVVEEAWEFLHAVRQGDRAGACEELGDLLMLVVLVGEVAASRGEFTLEGAARSVREKLIRRHPHVFGNAEAQNPVEVKEQWSAVKAAEGKEVPSDGLPPLPATLPALTQGVKLGKAASEHGFDWPDENGPLQKIEEELGELREALRKGDRACVAQEVGDLLFAVSSFSRKVGVDPEAALRDALARFRLRFRAVYRGISEGRLTDLDAMEGCWEEQKRTEWTDHPDRGDLPHGSCSPPPGGTE